MYFSIITFPFSPLCYKIPPKPLPFFGHQVFYIITFFSSSKLIMDDENSGLYQGQFERNIILVTFFSFFLRKKKGEGSRVCELVSLLSRL